MTSNKIIGSPVEIHNYDFLKKTTYKIVILIITFIVVNLILIQKIPLEDYLLRSSDGSNLTAAEMRKINIRSILLIIPFMGFALGSILSFVPFKKLHYKRKYLRFSLLAMIILYSIQFWSYLKFLLN